MPRGKLKTKKDKKKLKKDPLPVVDNVKIRKSLLLMIDKFNEDARDSIKDAYNNTALLKKYQRIRDAGSFQKGGKSGVHRRIVAFPTAQVFEFVNTIMTAKYGRDWLYDNRALKHELVKPWWVVKKL